MTERKLKEKILTQFREEVLDSIKIIKKTKNRIEFEIESISGVYNIVMKTAPVWFTNWATEFEKRNNKRFDSLEEELNELKTIVKKNHPKDFK